MLRHGPQRTRSTRPVTRPRPRATRDRAARPAPGLARARAGHGRTGRRRDPPSGLDALLGGLNPDQLRAVTHGDGPAARRRRRRDRQDPGHHPPDRLADRDAPRQAVGDPGPDLHRQGRRGDGGPRRPARPVRLHGHRDLDVPRLRRRPDPRVRARARAAARRARAVARRGRDLPARAPVRVRARRVPAARRPDPLPGRARDAVQPLQGRGHRARRPTSRTPTGLAAEAAARGRGGRTGDATRRGRWPRRRAGRPSWPAPTRATRSCSRPTASSTSATRSRSRCGSSASRPRPATRDRRRGSGTSSSTSSRTRTGPRRSSSRSLAERASQRDRRRRRRPGDLRVPRRGDRATSSSSATATRARGPSSCGATTARSRRSSTPPTGSSASTTRTGSRSGPGSSSGCAPSASTPTAPRRSALEAFATGAEEADWIAAEIGRRIADGRARRATTRSSSARTATPIRSCGRSTWPAIPWRFSGTSGLYARPEVRLLLVVPARRRRPRRRASTSTRSRRRTCTALGGEDLTAIVNTARRRNRSRVGRCSRSSTASPGILRVCARRRRAAVAPARRRPARATRRSPTSGRPARCCTRSCAAAGCWRGSPATDTSPPRRRSRTSPASSRSSARSRRCSPTTGRCSSRATSQTLIEAGDDPATAELDPDADAVAVLTVHKAKGLEFPVVFLPGLVAGRFPATGRGEPLALPAGLGRGEPPTAETRARRGAAAVLRRR